MVSDLFLVSAGESMQTATTDPGSERHVDVPFCHRTLPEHTAWVTVYRLGEGGGQGGSYLRVTPTPLDAVGWTSAEFDEELCELPPGRYRMTCRGPDKRIVRGGQVACEVLSQGSLPIGVPPRRPKDYPTTRPATAGARSPDQDRPVVEAMPDNLGFSSKKVLTWEAASASPATPAPTLSRVSAPSVPSRVSTLPRPTVGSGLPPVQRWPRDPAHPLRPPPERLQDGWYWLLETGGRQDPWIADPTDRWCALQPHGEKWGVNLPPNTCQLRLPNGTAIYVDFRACGWPDYSMGFYTCGHPFLMPMRGDLAT